MSSAIGILIVVALLRGKPLGFVLPVLLGAIVAVTLLKPAWLAPAERLARLAQSAIGWSLMAIGYFAVLTPVALLRRLIERDPLGVRLDRTATSYWVERPPQPDWVERLSRLH